MKINQFAIRIVVKLVIEDNRYKPAFQSYQLLYTKRSKGVFYNNKKAWS